MTRRKNYAFSKKALLTRTPTWANWMFRICLLITSTATFVIASDPAIPDDLKVRINVYVTALNLFVLGLSKMFGVVVEEVK